MDAHSREYAGAVAGMTETYGAWTPRPGDRVRCPQAFGGGQQDGTVHCREQAGTYLVDTPEGRLRLNAQELELIVAGAATIEPCRAPEPLTTPARLGSHNAAAARRAGCEDEYDNAIEARYGKGW